MLSNANKGLSYQRIWEIDPDSGVRDDAQKTTAAPVLWNIEVLFNVPRVRQGICDDHKIKTELEMHGSSMSVQQTRP
ncbi:hypothetical protein RRG08_025753 [Elysia crispata]|uniref:Uncharacterized protein n=1 Tax=Elysia crispata TaxID=231223 RepID=A0AAE1AHU1_9GAST|nr:hypothetical protein RRG08_025753 [Elysia crispata]